MIIFIALLSLLILSKLYVGTKRTAFYLKDAFDTLCKQVDKRITLISLITNTLKKDRKILEIIHSTKILKNFNQLTPEELKKNIDIYLRLEYQMDNFISSIQKHRLPKDSMLAQSIKNYLDTTDDMLTAKRLYNWAVRDFNAFVTIPFWSIVAGIFKYNPLPFFSYNENTTQTETSGYQTFRDGLINTTIN